MATNHQTQNQRRQPGNNSQSSNEGHEILQDQPSPLPKPKPKPPAHQSPEVMDKNKGGSKEDFKADEREAPGDNKRKEDQQRDQPKPKNQHNEAWQTGDSGIPENASDNANS